jgi:hypothetical protein
MARFGELPRRTKATRLGHRAREHSGVLRAQDRRSSMRLDLRRPSKRSEIYAFHRWAYYVYMYTGRLRTHWDRFVAVARGEGEKSLLPG